MDAKTLNADSAPPLLSPGDPPPFEVINPEGAADVLLICDHAAQTFPAALGDMGLNDEQRGLHIAWDIGAAAVTRGVSAALDAPAVLCGYSRLVIDCNRPPGHSEQIMEISDGHEIPGNGNLSDAQRAQRLNEIFWPYHAAVGGVLGRIRRRAGASPALLSVHSFTPVLHGEARPWDTGVIWRHDSGIARPLIRALDEDGLNTGDNLPYSGFDSAYSIGAHGDAAHLAHAALEIRQDHITDEAGQRAWTERLTRILGAVLTGPAA